jgi:hypothetical protein
MDDLVPSIDKNHDSLFIRYDSMLFEVILDMLSTTTDPGAYKPYNNEKK